jgi:hypothetical protein
MMIKKREDFTKGLAAILVKNKILVENEAVSLQEMFSESTKESFDDFLLSEGLVEEPDLLRALSEYYEVPSFDVVGYFFEHYLLLQFPKGFLLRNGIIPLDVDQNIVSVVASNPDEPGLESAIREYVSYDVNFLVGIRRDICDAVKEFYDPSLAEESDDVDLREERQLEHEAEEELDEYISPRSKSLD